jgi:hypothetical protein
MNDSHIEDHKEADQSSTRNRHTYVHTRLSRINMRRTISYKRSIEQLAPRLAQMTQECSQQLPIVGKLQSSEPE